MTKVERNRKKKKPHFEDVRDAKQRRHKRVGTKHEKGNALVIKSDQSKYSDALKAMRSDAKLVDVGADVRSIRHTRTGEMILDLKRDKERKGVAYKSLVKEVRDEGVKMWALMQGATLKVKKQDEVAEAEELVTVLRQQCDVQVATAAVRLRKRLAGTRIAMVHLTVADVKSSSLK